jgi:hypothetical protein
MGGQQPAHSRTEPVDKIGRLLVPMGLGQGGEAREVREQEGLHDRSRPPLCHRSPEPSSAYSRPRKNDSRSSATAMQRETVTHAYAALA